MDIKSQVRQFVLSNFYVADPASLRDDVSLLDSGVVDSTGIMEVISFLEQTYHMSVDESEMVPENLDSIRAIGDYVQRKRAAA